jgi:hypothetical protein
MLYDLDDLKYSAVCEGSTIKLRCDAGTNIVIVKADFGRDKYSSVCGEYYYDGNCTSRIETEEILRNLCGNKNTCDVVASTATFQDNCSGEQKILKAWYQCVGSSKRFKL